MVRFSSQTVLLVIATALALSTSTVVDAKKSKKVAYRQAQSRVEGIPDCSDEMYGTHCAKSNQGHREFCDHDSSILVGNIPRSICAPLSALKFLMGEGDYCGKCKPPEGLFVDIFYPTAAPSAAPSVAEAEQPIGGSEGTLSPVVVVPPPTTQAPTVTKSAAPSGSSLPSSTPSDEPSAKASSRPSGSSFPSSAPSDVPSIKASAVPSGSSFPSSTPSDVPSSTPSDGPSIFLKTNPLVTPPPSGSSFPSSTPSGNPSAVATEKPSGSSFPSSVPSGAPSTPVPSGSSLPSSVPSSAPSPNFPTDNPTAGPTQKPPTPEPVDGTPTENPTSAPTARPPVDVPTGGSDGGDGPTRVVPDVTTSAPTTATPSSSPSVSPAPSISASPSLPDPPVVAVTTEYSLTFIAEGVLPDDQLEPFEETVRDFLNRNQPLDPNRGTVVTKVTVLEQRLDNSFRSLRGRKLQTELPVTADLKIDGWVTPDDNEPYDFGDLVQSVFISHKLVLRNDLAAKGINLTFP